MSQSLFITGGSGYLGSHFLQRVEQYGYSKVVVLDRSGTLAHDGGITVIRGDLLDPASYEDAIEGGVTVVHLAALTGKGRRQEHFRVNAEATRGLLAAAKRRSARRFLFVSSIAVEFEDRAGYHYADAKLAAESAVSSSGMDTCSVRPTMIFGPDAPVLAGLKQLAKAPFVPVFGGGGHMCQPIHVDDLAAWLHFAISSLPFDGAVRSIGGPDAVTLRELLSSLRQKELGKVGGLITWPLAPTRFLLRLLEGPFMSLLPLTAGQLATFANDSTADSLSLDEGGHLICTSLADMIS